MFGSCRQSYCCHIVGVGFFVVSRRHNTSGSSSSVESISQKEYPELSGFTGTLLQNKELMSGSLIFIPRSLRKKNFHAVSGRNHWCQSKIDIIGKENNVLITVMKQIQKFLTTNDQLIQWCIERIIDHSQMGFMSRIQEWLYIPKSINVINHANRMKINTAQSSQKTEKNTWQKSATI